MSGKESGKKKQRINEGDLVAAGGTPRMLRFEEVRSRVALSRTTVWRLERAGKFPKRRQLSENSVGWIEAEVDGWVKCRLAAGKVSETGGENE
jgi:prophage regulatory protein